MNLAQAAKIVRKRLLIRDQPVKAYKLLDKLDLEELKELKNKTKTCIQHYFDYDKYIDFYSNLEEAVNPDEMFINAELRFMRFGWVLQSVDKQKAKTVVDLGCSDGLLVGTLAHRGYKAKGVNLSRKSIDVCLERKKKFVLMDAEFVCQDAMEVTGKYDAVVAQEILEHVPDDKKFIKKCLSLVSDKGWLYITTPDGPVEGGLGNKQNWECSGGLRGHLRVYNKETLENLLKDCEIKSLFSQRDVGVKFLFAQVRPK